MGFRRMFFSLPAPPSQVAQTLVRRSGGRGGGGRGGPGRLPGRLSKLTPRFGTARSKGDRDIDDSVTVLQDNRVLNRPHLYLLDVGRTNAPLLKLSLECGPVLRTKPVCHNLYLHLLRRSLDAVARCGRSLDDLVRTQQQVKDFVFGTL